MAREMVLVKTPFEGICNGCHKMIPVGAEAVQVAMEGLFHSKCVEDEGEKRHRAERQEEQEKLAQFEAKKHLRDCYRAMLEVAHALEYECDGEATDEELAAEKAYDALWKEDLKLAKDLRVLAARMRKLVDPRV